AWGRELGQHDRFLRADLLEPPQITGSVQRFERLLETLVVDIGAGERHARVAFEPRLHCLETVTVLVALDLAPPFDDPGRAVVASTLLSDRGKHAHPNSRRILVPSSAKPLAR